MATLPKATTTVDDTSGAAVGGIDTICILAPVATNADIVPRLFGSAAALYAQHGYSEGLEYAALHAEQTGKNFLFVGLPISTPGVIGRENKSGNTGSSVTTVSAGGSGVLAEHDGVLKVVTGGTIGSSQIVLDLSLDGGRTFQKVRLGTASSYAVPYFGISVGFGAGTLVAGDTIHTWHGSGPLSATADWATARAALAAQSRGFRSLMLVGDVPDDTTASALVAQLNAYETANQRFVQGRCSIRDRLPYATMSKSLVRMTGGPSLTFAEVGVTGDTITRASGSWLADGFAVGDTVVITGTASNNVTAVIASLSATVMTFGSEDLNPEVTSNASIVGYPTLTFAEVGGTGDTITRNRGSWLADGFRVGDKIVVSGTASNNITAAQGLANVTATVLTLGTDDLNAEVIRTALVTLTAGETKAAWMASMDAEFAPIDDEPRINISAGRGRVFSPFTNWFMRRPAGWFASVREYQHDAHIAPWRKDDGPVGADLADASGALVEWDDRVDGEAACAARFTALRTWPNGPQGAFIALDLTRASDGSLLVHEPNCNVTNIACGTVQLNTENAAIGQSIILNDDGTASKESLAIIEGRVNAALQLALRTDRGEGPRASKAVWAADPSTVYNVAEPLMVGVLDLNLNGIVHSVRTSVRIRSAGQA